MRSTTVLSFFVTSLALLSQSSIAYAAPIPSPVDSAAAKRMCDLGYCRIATGSDTNTDTASQSQTVQLAQVLFDALQQYLNGASPSNITSNIDLASTPEDIGSDDLTTVDDDLIKEVAALAGDAL